MAKRMSPKAQSNARSALQAEMKNVETGDAEMDSLLRKEVARRETFASAEKGKKPAKLNFFSKLFGGKKK